MRTVLTALVLLIATVVHGQDTTNLFRFTTQTENGPITERTAIQTTYSISGLRLSVTGDLDLSNPSRPLGMTLVVGDYRGPGEYTLIQGTQYRYGNRTDQVFTLKNGRMTVVRLDSNTNRMIATFWWNGVATLTSGVVLNVAITSGEFELYLKPKLVVTVNPGSGVKAKPSEKVPMNITVKTELGKAVQGATVEITGLRKLFQVSEDNVSLTTNASGQTTFQPTVKEDIEKGTYELNIRASKQAVLPSEALVYSVEVAEEGRYWYSKCAGLPFFEFDAGEGKKFTVSDDGFVESDDDVVWQGVLKLTGPVRIDTTPGRTVASHRGIAFNYSLGSLGELRFLPPGTLEIPCAKIVSFGLNEMLTKLSGGIMKDPILEFLGDGYRASGIKIGATVVLATNTWSGCNSDDAEASAPNKKVDLAFEGSATKALDSTGADAWSFSGKATLTNYSPISQFCVKSALISYNSGTDEFLISGSSRSTLYEEAGFELGFKKGSFDKLKVTFESNTCIPFGTSGLCWKGGSIAAENVAEGNPFKGTVTSLIQSKVTDQFEYEVTGSFETGPLAFQLDGEKRMARVEAISKSNPWQIKGRLSGRLAFAKYETYPTLSITGTLNLGHLGGSDYAFTGSAEVSMNGEKQVFAASLKDMTVAIPSLGEVDTEGMPLSTKIMIEGVKELLPKTLGKASGILSFGPARKYALANVSLAGLRSELKPIFVPMFDAIFGDGTAHVILDFNRAIPFEIGPGTRPLDFGALVGKGDGVQGETGIPVTVGEGAPYLLVLVEGSGESIEVRNPAGAVVANDVSGVVAASYEGFAAWRMANPVAGRWTVASPANRIEIHVGQPTTPFAPTLSVDGENLVATWDPQPDGTVEILGREDGDSTLAHVAEGNAAEGRLTLPLMSGALPCSVAFTARLTRATTAVTTVDVAVAEAFAFERRALPAPQNIRAIRNQQGTTVVSWDIVANPAIRAYAVDQVLDGLRSTLYVIGPDATSVTVQVANSDATIEMTALGANNTAGCPAPAVPIVTSVAEVSEGTLDVWPLPATDVVRLAAGNVPIRAWKVVDNHGRVLLSNMVGDAHTVAIAVGELPAGLYTVVVTTTEGNVVRPLPVIR